MSDNPVPILVLLHDSFARDMITLIVGGVSGSLLTSPQSPCQLKDIPSVLSMSFPSLIKQGWRGNTPLLPCSGLSRLCNMLSDVLLKYL
jgi:hypothetical protein